MNKICTIIILLTFSAASPATGIPVVDGLAIATSTTNQVETIAKWAIQAQQMLSQIEQLKQTYQAVTGSRGFGQIHNNPALKDYLPSDWQAVYDATRNGGYQGLTGRAKGIYEDNQLFDRCAAIKYEDERTTCESLSAKGSQDKANALEAYDKAKERVKQIDKLMGEIDSTEDPKAIAELQGRIAVEQANLQNEQIKLELYERLARAEDKLQEEKQRQINAQVWERDKHIDIAPLTFK